MYFSVVGSYMNMKKLIDQEVHDECEKVKSNQRPSDFKTSFAFKYQRNFSGNLKLLLRTSTCIVDYISTGAHLHLNFRE